MPMYAKNEFIVCRYEKYNVETYKNNFFFYETAKILT